MKKIVTIIGARPQFVKASVVSKALRRQPGLDEIVVHTGQHYDRAMSDIFFAQLDMPDPRYNLAIGSGSHGQQTGRMLEAIEHVLLEEKPDCVVVYGDTNSTLAGALAAAKLHIPVSHVEAGLRSFNRQMPEEINRIATDVVSTQLLAPTPAAAAQLKYEGIPEERIVCTGDVMFDAVLAAVEAIKANPDAVPVERPAGDYYLCTIHRAENTDDGEQLGRIVDCLSSVASEIPVVLPIHPRTRLALERNRLMDRASRLTIVEPLGYLEMISLLRNARAVLTDSGGLQKEAFFLGRPCYVFRAETEWTELVDQGWVQLVHQEAQHNPAALAMRILGLDGFTGGDCTAFGVGKAGDAIAEAIATLVADDAGRL